MLKNNNDYDLLIDHSKQNIPSEQLQHEIERITSQKRLISIAGSVTFILPEGFDIDPDLKHTNITAFHDPMLAMASALRQAERRGCALGVIKNLLNWSNLSLAALLEHAEADSMVGTIQGRFISPSADRLHSLPGQPAFTFFAAAARYLPQYYLTPEFDSCLLIITANGVRNSPRIEALPLPFDNTRIYRALRRRGLRNLVCNQIFIPTDLALDQIYPQRPIIDYHDLNAASDRPMQWLAEMPEQRLEAIFNKAFTQQGKPRLLIDCRGMGPFFNGTTVAILGFLQGFDSLTDNPFAIVVQAREDATLFHKLSSAFPNFEILTGEPQGGYLAAVLMNQPWSFETLRHYSGISWLNLYNMLDTISWDIGYPEVPNLQRIWSVAGQVADAILFISAYSRERYIFRFHPNSHMPLVVTHLNTSPKEIMVAGSEQNAGESAPFLLVVGNDYDHKALDQTLDTLAEAFPYLHIKALGIGSSRQLRVETLPSGTLSSERVAQLYATATAVVFPSHYEGFGLPVVEALASNTPVLVRSSPLWDEISTLSARAELILRFASEMDLIEKVAAILASPPQELKLTGDTETSWTDCAKTIIDTILHLAHTTDRNHWAKRLALLV